MENKKGQLSPPTTPMLIVIIFFSAILLTVLAITSWGFQMVDNQISQLDFQIGNQSFNETYQTLVHPGMETLSISGPRAISIGTLIGMVLVILFIGMKSGKRSNLWIILDVCIIIIAEIIAVTIKFYFQNYIMTLTPELFNIFITTFSDSSKWILNLPTIIPTVGALLILATYILRRENKEEREGGEEFFKIDDE